MILEGVVERGCFARRLDASLHVCEGHCVCGWCTSCLAAGVWRTLICYSHLTEMMVYCYSGYASHEVKV